MTVIYMVANCSNCWASLKIVCSFGSTSFLVSLAFFFWILIACAYFVLSPSDINCDGNLTSSLVKGALGGRVKGNERVVVMGVFFFERLNFYRENGGTCQSIVCDLAGGLKGSGGSSGVMEDSIC